MTTYNHMVVGIEDPDEIDLVFHALSDSTRRDIVARAGRDDYSVSGLARLYPMSFAAVQKHVAILQQANLVTKEKRGREQIVRPNPHGLDRAREVLDRFELLWRDRLDRFGRVLTDPDPS